MNNLDLPMITMDDETIFRMLKLLDIDAKCIICGEVLIEGNIGGIFPSKDVICKSLLCLSEYSVKQEDKNDCS